MINWGGRQRNRDCRMGTGRDFSTILSKPECEPAGRCGNRTISCEKDCLFGGRLYQGCLKRGKRDCFFGVFGEVANRDGVIGFVNVPFTKPSEASLPRSVHNQTATSLWTPHVEIQMPELVWSLQTTYRSARLLKHHQSVMLCNSVAQHADWGSDRVDDIGNWLSSTFSF